MGVTLGFRVYMDNGKENGNYYLGKGFAASKWGRAWGSGFRT